MTTTSPSTTPATAGLPHRLRAPAGSVIPGSRPLAPVVGHDLWIPVVPAGSRRLVHLDYAASAPPLESVAQSVERLLPWYASVHRGAGFPSAVSSDALAASRALVAQFLGARPDDTVVFTRNTTDSLNLLARSLPADTTAFVLDLEHHANLLPWRRGRVRQLETPRRVNDVPAVFEAALAGHRGPALVAVTGASNVTGELLPVAGISAVAHRHGARIVVDAAQLAPHRPIDLAATDVDYVVFSGHKIYAPYGAGVLAGRADWLDAATPYLAGGGAVGEVGLDRVSWATGHARHEAGTPNVPGAVAIAAACAALESIGWDAIDAHDRALTEHAADRLAGVPGCRGVLAAFEDADRVSILALALDRPAAEVAAALSAEHAIATRDGAFCAHPLMRRLAGVGDSAPVPNAVRISFGVGSTLADVDALAEALTAITTRGPRAAYAVHDGRLVPDVDTRVRPTFW